MLRLSAVGAVLMVAISVARADILLSENFEGAGLDSRISISSVGTFNDQPGVHAITQFGSAHAFGFGASTCGANCFGNFRTLLTITFPRPTRVDTVSFKEMEQFGNWGSSGEMLINGQLFNGGDFGRSPSNDRTPDTTYRTRTFSVQATVTTVELQVTDITNQSEIFVDDLTISGCGLGDFNRDGVVSVQDVFDFLVSYFAGCTATGPAPCQFGTADFSGDGRITVQDIFDYLAAYFAGCS